MQSDATELPVLEIPVHEITHVGISNDVEVTGPGLANSQPKSKKLPTILILWKSPRMLAAFWGGGGFCNGDGHGIIYTILAFFVSHTFHWSSLLAGLTFLVLLL